MIRGLSLACGILMLLSAALPARASLGGPDLAQPMGFDPKAREVYFRIIGQNESANAPVIARLSLADTLPHFEALTWSIETGADSSYVSRVRAIEARLRPLEALQGMTTIPEYPPEIIHSDSVSNRSYEARRFRVRVRFRCGTGWIEAVTFREPSIRLLHCFRIPGEKLSIGVFSYVGVPTEVGYEVQVPVALTTTEYNGVLVIAPFWQPRHAWWTGPEATMRPGNPVK